eukprot:7312036-Ditylum_brightwellii.AAC.1
MGCHKCLVEFQRSLLVCVACIYESLEGLSGVIAKLHDVKAKLVKFVRQGIEKVLRGSDAALC